MNSSNKQQATSNKQQATSNKVSPVFNPAYIRSSCFDALF